MKSLFSFIALDADDTLWHNERLYIEAQARFVQLLAHYHSPDWISERLYQTELRNLQHFGYGIKAFVLSMIETAVELTEGRISGKDIQTLIDEARIMLSAEVQLVEHAAATVAHLAERYPLMVITKGDPLDQESKLANSGLAGYFEHIEVVSDKTRTVYERLLKRFAIDPARFVMVGNSLRSDILPVLELGGCAVYIPYETTWMHEVVDEPPPGCPGYYKIEHLGQLPALLEEIVGAGGSAQIT